MFARKWEEKNYDLPEADQATVVPMTQDELARQRRSEGSKVVWAHARYWLETSPGFYDGLHWLSRCDVSQARRPSLACWGYRAVLADSSARWANAAIPVHLMRDLADRDARSLPARMARYFRAMRASGVRIAHVTSPEILRDQGYEVMLSWRVRTGLEKNTPSLERYLAYMERHVTNPGWLVLAAVCGSNLLGYMTCWAVDETAYLQDLHVRTEAMRLRVGTALYFEMVQALRRSGKVSEVSPGLHMPELPRLTRYKTEHGFPVVHVPAKLWLAPLCGNWIKRRSPLKYYRLTGDETVLGQAKQETGGP